MLTLDFAKERNVMNHLPEISWEKLYAGWKLYSRSAPQILSLPITPSEIHMDYDNTQGSIYGYDWLPQAVYEQYKELFATHGAGALYRIQPTNKGTLHTLNMLIHSQNDEERAAIWLYAYAKEILFDHSIHTSSIGGYAHQICNAASEFLSQHYYMWHHAMSRLVPELFTNWHLLADTDFHSLQAVIELARLNASLILYEYIPVVYSSLPPGETVPKYSVRRDTIV